MKIGVKFCGGCNPKYDRGALFERTLKNYSEHCFEYADETKEYDALLVICGCERACANTSRYRAGREMRVSENLMPEL